MKNQTKTCSATLCNRQPFSSNETSQSLSKTSYLREFKFKESQNSKRKRKTLSLQTDDRTQVYVAASPGALFGCELSYTPRPDSNDPESIFCDVYLDGRKLGGWFVHSNGHLKLEELLSQQHLSRLQFPELDQENQNASKPICSGTLEIIFYRVMKLDPSIQQESDMEEEDVPDEGLPALSILCFHYRDESWLRSSGVLRGKNPYASSLKSMLSTPGTLNSRLMSTNSYKESDDLLSIGDCKPLSPLLRPIDLLLSCKQIRRRVPVSVDFQSCKGKSGYISIDKNTSMNRIQLSIKGLLECMGLQIEQCGKISFFDHNGAVIDVKLDVNADLIQRVTCEEQVVNLCN